MNQPTLYERIGGDKAVEGIVKAFYSHVFADPELAPFFKDADKQRLMKMMHEFVGVALEGPVEYTGRELTQAHQGLGITPEHVTRFVDHLRNTLRGQLSEQDALDLISNIDMRADAVLGRSNVEG